MIKSAEIINQPYSGEYDEVIYDIPCSSVKGNLWGWVKFTNENYTEWCGEFRGTVLGVEISERFNSVLILTTDCLFMLDRKSGKVIDTYGEPQYKEITLSPSDEYILASFYEVVVLKDSLKDPIYIEVPSGTCSVKFLEWKEHELILEYDDYFETCSLIKAVLDTETYELRYL